MEPMVPIDHLALGDSLLTSTRRVLDTMISMHVDEDCDSPLGRMPDPVWGIIGFKGDDLEGAFGLCIAQEGAQAITARMLNARRDAPLSIAKVVDAIGEMANVIMGNLKASSDPALSSVQVSLPSVGRGHTMPHELGDKGIEEVFVDISIDDLFAARVALVWRHL